MMQQPHFRALLAIAVFGLLSDSFPFSPFALAEMQVSQAPAPATPEWMEMFSWFHDWLGNSLTFPLAYGAATGLSLGFLLRAWIRQTGSVFVGLFTGITIGIFIGLVILKPVFRIDHTWMILLPVICMMVFRGAISALSLKTAKEGFGSYFVLTTLLSV